MTIAEILAVPDSLRSDADALALTRFNIRQTRRLRRIDLNENTPVSRTAAMVNEFALRVLGLGSPS